ncbi:hypothetical protein D1007_51663 [Hordeum vulgare]|nr:hypothetical protein D1007_51663 [Hordeum vulgare]
MYDQSHVIKMLSDPEIVKDVHLYVSKEKAGDDVAPPSKQFDIALSNHPNESVLLREGGVYAEGEGMGKLTMKRPQRPLRRSKRLNVIQVTDQCDDDDGGCNNGEQFAPGHESEALDNEQGQDHNQEDVDIDQWRGLVKFWKSKKERALAEKNIISLSLVKNSHNAGTKSFACWSEDMRQADPEKKRPRRSQVYLATHKKKDDANAENIDRNERLAGSKVVLKTSTYPNKRNFAYGTIRSTGPRTKACGIELGAEFAFVLIDQPLLDNEELVREVSDCKTIGEAFSSGYLIAWPSASIREKDN